PGPRGVAVAERGLRNVSAAALLRLFRRSPVNLPARGRGRRRSDCFTRNDDGFRHREFHFGFSECALALSRPDSRPTGWIADCGIFADAHLSIALCYERKAGCNAIDRHNLSWLTHADERARIGLAISLAWRLRRTGNVGQGDEPVAHSSALRRFDNQAFSRAGSIFCLVACVRNNYRRNPHHLRMALPPDLASLRYANRRQLGSHPRISVVARPGISRRKRLFSFWH